MRIWSLHPSYLDSKGLVALWRETLLAQNVLLGKTKGYKNHPQLERFKATENPVGAISCYLDTILEEASTRNYAFNKEKIHSHCFAGKIEVTQGQLDYEFHHLLNKLALRAPALYQQFQLTKSAKLHPLFSLIEGDIESWEVIKP
jgi:hypothetical protein